MDGDRLSGRLCAERGRCWHPAGGSAAHVCSGSRIDPALPDSARPKGVALRPANMVAEEEPGFLQMDVRWRIETLGGLRGVQGDRVLTRELWHVLGIQTPVWN